MAYNIDKIQSGESTYLAEIKSSSEYEAYKAWCDSRGVTESEESAEFYFDQTVSDYCEEDVFMTM